MPEGNNDKLHIRLHVYDTDMPVFVLREDEEYYRKAAKLITDTVNAYADRFRGTKTVKDLLYMGLIDIALRYEKESAKHDTVPFTDILTKLTSEIDDAMKK